MNAKSRFHRHTDVFMFCLVAACGLPAAAASGEIIDLRSGQVGGLPGLAGQFEDIMTFGPTVASGPLSAVPFTAADFNATTANTAIVIDPDSSWIPGITYDPLARWVGTYPVPFSGGHILGKFTSTLYRVPFTVTSTNVAGATMSIAWSSDDTLGDLVFGGANPVGAYLRSPGGVVTPLVPVSGGNFHIESLLLNINIGSAIGTGQNELFLYQRDQGFGAAGVIFSAHMIIPAPGSPAALLGLCGLIATRRNRAEPRGIAR